MLPSRSVDSGRSRLSRSATPPWAPLAALVLAACSSTGPKPEVPECADARSPACAAARDRFQVLNYEVTAPGRLVAASSRAIGDLNFELVRRDDDAGLVLARYVGSAPTHKDQLDSSFHEALRDAASLPLMARIEVGKTVGSGTSVPVRLQFLLPPASAGSATEPVPLDRVKPYQIFFQQLSLELGGRISPPEGASRRDDDKPAHKPTVLPGPASVPSGL